MVGVTRAFTPSLSGFVETSNVLQAKRPDTLAIDAGLAWARGPDLQLDASMGHSFFDRGEDWFVSAGITLRRR